MGLGLRFNQRSAADNGHSDMCPPGTQENVAPGGAMQSIELRLIDRSAHECMESVPAPVYKYTGSASTDRLREPLIKICVYSQL